MTSLLDIAPLTETVSVGGKDVDVYGLSAEGLVNLIARFPEVRQLLGGGKRGAGLGVEEVLDLGGKVVASIIAAGCGLPGNKEAEVIASRMGLDAQADFIGKIMKLTLPNGLAPLVAKLTAIGAIVEIEDEALPKVLAMKSQRSSRS